MDISSKIKRIRENNNLTQEQFAKMLFVSRTAVSKWELQKGYPSIESLKLISEKFNVSLDDLLSSSDVFLLADEELKLKKKKNKMLFNAIFDILPIFIFFLPFFSVTIDNKIVCLPLFKVEISTLKFVLYTVSISCLIIVGIIELINIKLDSKKIDKLFFPISFIVFIISIALFIECKQIYSSVFMLGLLAIKGFLAIKTK